MGAEDEIGYAGPALVYEPSVGGNTYAPPTRFRTPAQRSYADVDRLDAMLAFLIQAGGDLAAVVEEDLVKYGLPIQYGDTKLIEAVKIEWPAALNETRDHISYRFYRYLVVKRTTSAAYIRQRFEEGVRDFTGTHSLDILTLAQTIIDEAKLVQEFRSTYVGAVDDQSEHRTIELFMDWTESARMELERLTKLHNTRDAIVLANSEVDVTTPREAKNAQAMFKVKLNVVNRQIADTVGFIKRNYSEHAPTFYGKFLGPALQFRLNASRGFHPSAGLLGVEMQNTANALDTNLAVVQADQQRRNALFTSKMAEATDQIAKQNVYRNYINQLSPVGKTVVPGQGGTAVVLPGEDDGEVQYFESDDVRYTPAAAPPLSSSHSALAELGIADAHPQYLLKSGGTITGDIFVDAGVTIDGVDVGEHEHTGVDGSKKVQGGNIEGGTVTPVVIDHDVSPDTPTNLHLLSQSVRIVPPGVTVVDIQIAWEGEDHNTFEVQTVPMG